MSCIPCAVVGVLTPEYLPAGTLKRSTLGIGGFPLGQYPLQAHPDGIVPGTLVEGGFPRVILGVGGVQQPVLIEKRVKIKTAQSGTNTGRKNKVLQLFAKVEVKLWDSGHEFGK